MRSNSHRSWGPTGNLECWQLAPQASVLCCYQHPLQGLKTRSHVDTSTGGRPRLAGPKAGRLDREPSRSCGAFSTGCTGPYNFESCSNQFNLVKWVGAQEAEPDWESQRPAEWNLAASAELTYYSRCILMSGMSYAPVTNICSTALGVWGVQMFWTQAEQAMNGCQAPGFLRAPHPHVRHVVRSLPVQARVQDTGPGVQGWGEKVVNQGCGGHALD